MAIYNITAVVMVITGALHGGMTLREIRKSYIRISMDVPSDFGGSQNFKALTECMQKVSLAFGITKHYCSVDADEVYSDTVVPDPLLISSCVDDLLEEDADRNGQGSEDSYEESYTECAKARGELRILRSPPIYLRTSYPTITNSPSPIASFSMGAVERVSDQLIMNGTMGRGGNLGT